MSRLNKVPLRPKLYTHEGALAYQHATATQQLRRSVLSCMLWEDSYYEDGVAIAERISSLVAKVPAEDVAAIAVEAREKMNLRHVPLLLACELAKLKTHRHVVADLVERVIQRADELAEILAIYEKLNPPRTGTKRLHKLSAQLKRGVARAFTKFNEYNLAKYNRDGAIKLRDVLFLTHPEPKDEEQAALWKRLVDGQLAVPDTWEVALSASKGESKKEVWERLLRQDKLGALALIRNLRNMQEAKVDKKLVRMALASADISRVLPFRFVAAAKAAPGFEEELDALLLKSAQCQPKLPGKTILIVDVSGSMYGYGNISKRSDMSRVEAAGALAAIARECCEEVSIYATAGNDASRVHATAQVPNYRGLALVDKFTKHGFSSELGGGGIFLVQCLDYIAKREDSADRIIVFTDEQDCDLKLKPENANAFGKQNYLINISVEKNGIAYKPKWQHIDGFSEHVIEYIRASERQAEQMEGAEQ